MGYAGLCPPAVVADISHPGLHSAGHDCSGPPVQAALFAGDAASTAPAVLVWDLCRNMPKGHRIAVVGKAEELDFEFTAPERASGDMQGGWWTLPGDRPVRRAEAFFKGVHPRLRHRPLCG